MEIPELNENDDSKQRIETTYLGINDALLKTNVAFQKSDYKYLNAYLNILLCYKFESRMRNSKFLHDPNPFYEFAQEITAYNAVLDLITVHTNGVFYPLIYNNNIITAPWSRLSMPFLFNNSQEEIIPDFTYSYQGAVKAVYLFHCDKDVQIPDHPTHYAVKIWNKPLETLEVFLEFFQTKRHLSVAHNYLLQRLFHLSKSETFRTMFRGITLTKVPTVPFDIKLYSKYNTIVYEHLNFIRTSPYSVSFSATNKSPIKMTKLLGTVLTQHSFENIMMEEEYHCIPAFRKLFYMPIDDFINLKLRFGSQQDLQSYQTSDIFYPYIVEYDGECPFSETIKLPKAPLANYDEIDSIQFFRHLEISKKSKKVDIPAVVCAHVNNQGVVKILSHLTEQYQSNSLILPDGYLAFQGQKFKVIAGRVVSDLFFMNNWGKSAFDYDLQETLSVNRFLIAPFVDTNSDFNIVINNGDTITPHGVSSDDSVQSSQNNTNKDK